MYLDEEDQAEVAAFKGLTAVRASTIKPKPREWLWHHTIPNRCLTVLGGMPKSGKSTLTCSLVGSALGDNDWPDGKHAPADGTVIMIGNEDDFAETIIPRLIAAGVKSLDRVVLVRMDHIEDLPELLEEHRPSVVFIDPLIDVLKIKDNNDMSGASERLQIAVNMARDYGVAIVGVCHDRKSTEGSSLDRVLGSRAFTSKPRAIIQCGKGRDTNDGAFCAAVTATDSPSHGFFYNLETTVVQSEDGPIETVRVVWLREAEGSADELLETRASRTKKLKGHEAEEWLRSALEHGPIPSKLLIDRARDDGISESTLKRARRTLGVISEGGNGKPSTWRLPTGPELLAQIAPDLSNAA